MPDAPRCTDMCVNRGRIIERGTYYDASYPCADCSRYPYAEGFAGEVDHFCLQPGGLCATCSEYFKTSNVCTHFKDRMKCRCYTRKCRYDGCFMHRKEGSDVCQTHWVEFLSKVRRDREELKEFKNELRQIINEHVNPVGEVSEHGAD